MSVRSLVVASVVIASAGSSRADDTAYVPPEFLTVTPAMPPIADNSAPLKLDLAEALRLAVKQNLEINLERTSLQMASLGIDAAKGAFEPTVTASYSHSGSVTPPTNQQEGMAGDLFRASNDGWTLGASDKFTTGTQLDVTFGNGRADSTAGNVVEPINYRSFLAVRVSQPLLRGFSPDLVIPKIDVLRAQLSSEHEKTKLVVSVAELVERTEGAYWDLLQAIFRYDLAQRSLALAEDQKKLTQRQIDNGTVASSEVIGAESTLAGRKLAVLQEEQGVARASDQLRAILNLPRDQWSKAIVPTEIPTFAPVHATVDEAFAQAMKLRPELSDLDLSVKEAALSVRSAENATLPQLDLALEGQATGQDSGYGGALGQLGSVEARGYSVMLNFSWTPLQRAAHANAEIAKIRGELVSAQKQQLIQKVWLEIRDAVRNGDSADLQLRAAAQFRTLAEKTLEIEQKKFLNGSSQQLQVAQRQEELSSARLAEVTALLAQKRSTAALLRSTGQLLDQRHIQLDVKK